MGFADLITEFILDAMRESDTAELRRYEIAERFGCVPSQVNYVIATRFSPDSGYTVESRRGGGGYIRISRSVTGREALIMHTAAHLGSAIDAASCTAIIRNLVDVGATTPSEARLMAAACSIQALSGVPPEQKAEVRAEILKRMLVSL